MPSFTFKKEERLKSRKIIGKLFKEGHSFTSYPLRLVWTKMDTRLSDFPAQMALTVPKRAFPKAVDRNRLRRRIREAYRLNKHFLYKKLEDQDDQFGLMFIYVAKEIFDSADIEKGVQKGLRRLAWTIIKK